VALSRLEWLIYAGPRDSLEALESTLPQMIGELEAAGDERGLARARWLAFWVQWGASRGTAAAEQVKRAAVHARAAGDVGLWSRALGWYVATLIYGPADASTMAVELDVIEREDPGPYLRGCVLIGRAEVERLGGRFGPAHELASTALEQFHSLGMRMMAAICGQTLASIALTSGDAAAAIEPLEQSDEILVAEGEQVMRSTTLAMLGRARAAMNDTPAAHAAVVMAEELSAPRDIANFVITHMTRAALAERAGELEGAERWARSALEHALRTDFIDFQADARLALATALAAGARTDDAVQQAREALALYELKQDVPGARRARAVLSDLVVA
jgi:tetratricopeptide (TPR) repeat protein